jgi:putative endonuclease
LKTADEGRRWESAAESFLRREGLKTLERNYRCRLGEIDLVMRDGASLVFVEVRFRHRAGHGSGAESVTRAKQRRLARAAASFLGRHPRWSARPCRFDVVSIGLIDGSPKTDWIKNAFNAPDA